MKRIIYYLFFLISPFTSCVMDDLSLVSTLMWDEDFDLAPRIPSEATELEVPFIFGTSANWSVVISYPLTKSQSWCSTTQDNGTRSYEITLHLIFEPNDTAEDRVVNVTIKTLFDSVLLVVTQAISEDALTPEESSITYNDSFALFQSVFADSKVLTPEFVFNATEAWRVECKSEGDWISVSNSNGEKGDLITLRVNFEENTNEDEEGREGTITISTSKDKVILTIKQHAKGVSIIPPLDFALEQTVLSSATSLDPPFKFSVQEGWTVTVTPEGEDKWLSVDKTEGEEGNNIPLAITFDANTTDQREGRVTITTEGGSSVKLTIIQLGETIEITYPDDFDIIQTVLSSATILTPSFSFSVQEAWTVTVTPEGDDQWLTVEKQDGGEAGIDIAFPITFEANATDVERDGTVTITANSGHSVTLRIKQYGQDVGIIPPLDFELTQTVLSSATSLDPPFVFSVQEGWTVAVTPAGAEQWLTADKMEGEAGYNIPLAITFEANTIDPREGTVTITTVGGSSVKLTIIQLGETIEITYPDDFDIIQTVLSSAGALDPEFEFSVQEAWTVDVTPEGDEQWLTVEKQDGGEAGIDIAFPITFEANATDVERDGTVTITANSGHSVTLKIKQLGDVEIEFSYDEDFELTQTIAHDIIVLDPEFVFNSPDAWGTTVTTTDATGDVSWIKVIGFGGDGINIKLPITFEENETYFDRTAKIILKTTSNEEVEFTVTQEAFPVAEFTYDAVFDLPQTVAYDATTIDPVFEFSVNDSWRATVSGANSSWLTIDDFNSVNGETATDYTLPITFGANTTYDDRIATITLSFTDPRVDDLVFTVTQQPTTTIAIITVSTPQKFSDIEGFRKNKIDVKAYDGDPGGHDASSGGGGYIIHNFQGIRTVYIPYNITLSNSKDYTWRAISSFNIKDAGLVSSVDYIDDDNTAKAKEVTGDDGQGVYLFIDVTGPGDEDITGTLTIETVLKDEDNINKEVYRESFELTITTNCLNGYTEANGLVWDDRNRGISVPSKAEEPVAQYYANVLSWDGKEDDFVGNEDYKGDYYNWYEAKNECSSIGGGWRLPTYNELKTLVNMDMRFSKTRAFVVFDVSDNLYDYTGAWFPIAGFAGVFAAYGYYWSSTEANTETSNGESAHLMYLYKINGTIASYDTKTFGYSVRCVKNAP